MPLSVNTADIAERKKFIANIGAPAAHATNLGQFNAQVNNWLRGLDRSKNHAAGLVGQLQTNKDYPERRGGLESINEQNQEARDWLQSYSNMLRILGEFAPKEDVQNFNALLGRASNLGLDISKSAKFNNGTGRLSGKPLAFLDGGGGGAIQQIDANPGAKISAEAFKDLPGDLQDYFKESNLVDKAVSNRDVTSTGTDFDTSTSTGATDRTIDLNSFLSGSADFSSGSGGGIEDTPLNRSRINAAVQGFQRTGGRAREDTPIGQAINAILDGADINTVFGQGGGATDLAGLLSTDGLNFSTGSPDLDDFLNNQWLPLMQAELANDPSAILNDEAFANIKERVEAAYGPIFQNELNIAQETFGQIKAEIDADRARVERELGTDTTQGTQLERGLADIGTQESQIQEDAGIKKERIARNFQEAMADSQAALAARSLSYGGTRRRNERRLGEQKAEDIGTVDRTANRALDELDTERQRLQSDIPFNRGQSTGALDRRLSTAQTTLGREENRIAGERTIQEAEERRRLRELGGSLLGNQSFI